MNPVKLSYEEFGDAGNPSLIIIHGFFASSRNWRQIAKKLAVYFHIYVLDMRNHGLSPHHPVMDYPSMAADLKSFMDLHEIQNASLLGHSMGGKVAMWLALNNPETIKHLIIADISPVQYQHNFDQTIQALNTIPLDQIANRKQADEHLSLSITELSYRQFLLQNLILLDQRYQWRIDLDIFYHNADNIVGFPDSDLKSNLNGKVMFIMGGKSDYYNQQAINKYFSNAYLTFIEDASHWLHIQNPEEFCENVVQFLNQ